MAIQNLYHMLKNISPEQDSILATITDGIHLGEQLLIYGRQPVFYSANDPDNFLKCNLPSILEAKDNLFLKLNGETILLENFRQVPSLIICGGGHVAIEVLLAAQKLNFSTTVLEDRILFANSARQAKADLVICDNFEQALDQIVGGNNTYFVIVTRGHRYDKECLRSISKKSYAYVGLMGSRGRVALLKKELSEEGISQDFLDSLHSPIGLNIGAETPAEIAISIVAELIQVRQQNKKASTLDPDVIKALSGSQSDYVLCTIVKKSGSAPRSVGTRMVVFADRTVVGTIGGGCVEADVITQAIDFFHTEEHAKRITVSMSAATAEDEGLVCGGTIDILLQKA